MREAGAYPRVHPGQVYHKKEDGRKSPRTENRVCFLPYSFAF